MSAITDNSRVREKLALNFNREMILGECDEKIRALVSEDFKMDCRWNYGKKVQLSNVEQFIGLLKLGIRPSTRKDRKVELLNGDAIKVRSEHLEKPCTPMPVDFHKIINEQTFYFSEFKGDTKIHYVLNETTVLMN